MAEPPADKHTVVIEVDGAPVTVAADGSLLVGLQDADQPVRTACGGQGSCHLCRVTVVGGPTLPPPNAIERHALGNAVLASGVRLACQLRPISGLALTLPAPRGRRRRSGVSR